MLELEVKIENYELGFHLLPETEEAEAGKKLHEIEESITQLGGKILASREPKRQHLSYEINHKKYSLFGTINFQAPTESIAQLESQLKLDDSVLRFLFLKIRENAKYLKSLKESSSRTRTKTYTPPKPDDKPKEEIKPEVMEKQLEDVIGNI
ncbi:MAG: 30S ribosomal protein S6 [bacterium]|nr:30S ribosomal protein S6 [bacterium]